ncbi:MAG: tRNA preQ1(34) S-adenosylmethionine ribosyltransferase-isomerase QueA [bacterium]
MLTSEFDYYLPKELIAQEPSEKRDESRLLILNRQTGEISEAIFHEIINYLSPNDILILNDTRVIPARIFGTIDTNRRVELLLLREIEPGLWEALSRPARKVKPGVKIRFNKYQVQSKSHCEERSDEAISKPLSGLPRSLRSLAMTSELYAEVIERRESGIRIVKFSPNKVQELLTECGEIALPPYIRKKCKDINRYQTIYGFKEGAIAAPTAGLHFTEELLKNIRAKGIETVFLTLHSGLGTFRPVKVETVEEHKMYPEEFEISEEITQKINQAKNEKRRVIAIGTTVVRALENQAQLGKNGRNVKPGMGLTNLYIYPPYDFKIVDGLITNFHLPKSTLLMLVCAFANKEQIFRAYDYAIAHQYRFYSFGDAMLII